MKDAIEQEIMVNAPITTVWEVVTRPEHFANWLGCTAEFELKPGAKGKLAWEKFGEAPLVIVDVDEPNHFSFRWVSPDEEAKKSNGETLVSFVLSEVNDGTKLRLTESGFDQLDLTQAEKDSLRGKHTNGWATFMGNAKQYISKL